MKKRFYVLMTAFVILSAGGGFWIGQKLDTKTLQKPAAVTAESPAEKIKDINISKPVEIASRENIDANAVFGVDIMLADKCIAMLREDFIREVDLRKLCSGAVKGMKDYAKEKHLDDGVIKPIGKSVPDTKLLEELHKSYYDACAVFKDKADESELAYAALTGLMDTLGDPYSVALPPASYKILNEFIHGGNYGGIGVYLEKNKKTGRITLLNIIKGGPAAKAGLKSGDVIIKINGEPVSKTALDMASHKIRGKNGTRVTLLVDRANEGLKEFSVVREIIHEDSVESSLKPGGIGYIRISVFGEDTGDEFSDALDELVANGAKGIIIDIRDNSGGFISSAIDVCSRLTDGGSLIVSVVNPRTGRNEVYRSSGIDKTDMPVVILANRNSASASEITAGALRDINSSMIIGEQTYGKAAVQSIREMRDGGAVKFTVAKYLTPKGTDIDKTGITPDITVKMDPKLAGTPDDIQMQRAVKELKNLIVKKDENRKSGITGLNEEKPVDPLNDL